MIYCWKACKEPSNPWFYLCREKPKLIEEDDFMRGYKKGEITCPFGTWQTKFPEDLLPALPPYGFITQVDLENLQEVAGLLSSYNEWFWTNLRQMVEVK